MKQACKLFIEQLPKAELHVHIEGTMEPAQYLSFAQRNNITVAYSSSEQVQSAYRFTSYQSFIDAYIRLTKVICTEQDFYDLTTAYLHKVAAQGVVHTEIFFDFQSYTPRGIQPAVIVNGMHQALVDAKKKFTITGGLIMCFLRHLPEADAFKALEQALLLKDKILGVGLATVEEGNPPSKFKRVFAKAQEYGFHRVAHVAECGEPRLIMQAIEDLAAERIDHGIRVAEDPELMRHLAALKMPFTVCPYSNVALLNYTFQTHPLKKMYDAGLSVSINSDDPAFFGGNYIAQNYLVAAEQMGFTCKELVRCARNSFLSAFCSPERKVECLKILEHYAQAHHC
jgi:adenosine deaminase